MDQPVPPVEDVNLPPPISPATPAGDYQPAPAKKKMSGWLIALIVVLVLCCCLVLVGGGVFLAFGSAIEDVFNNMDLNNLQYLAPLSRFVM